jgi:hypothetical protein
MSGDDAGKVRAQFEQALHIFGEASYRDAVIGQRSTSDVRLRESSNRVAEAKLAVVAAFEAGAAYAQGSQAAPQPFADLVRKVMTVCKDEAASKAVLLMLAHEGALTITSDWEVAPQSAPGPRDEVFDQILSRVRKFVAERTEDACFHVNMIGAKKIVEVFSGSVAPPEAERRCQICCGTEEDHRKAVQKCSITHASSPKAERQQEEEK